MFFYCILKIETLKSKEDVITFYPIGTAMHEIWELLRNRSHTLAPGEPRIYTLLNLI